MSGCLDPPNSKHSPGRGDTVILVDETGGDLGDVDRTLAHRGHGQRHRALTVLLFQPDNRLVFARRAAGKLLWPGFFDATVATHQRRAESDIAAAARRVPEEIGVTPMDLLWLGTLCYHARYNDEWSENERCELLVGRVGPDLMPQSAEISETQSIALAHLDAFTASCQIAPWFPLAWTHIRSHHAHAFHDWLAQDVRPCNSAPNGG